jgi:hypothetical protein
MRLFVVYSDAETQTTCDRAAAGVRGKLRRSFVDVDLYGTKPIVQAGRHFGRTYGDWTLLGLLVLGLCDKERTSPCQEWFNNEGNGLGAEEAAALADNLQARIDDGSVDEYVTHCQHMKAQLEEAGVKRQTLPAARISPVHDSNSLHRRDVDEFLCFLRACGGFKIC